jgi:hypothetical protein
MLKSAKIVDKYLMLLKYDNGESLLFDYSKYVGQAWFDHVIETGFENFFIEGGSVFWNDYDGVDPDIILEEGHPVNVVAKAIA